MSEGTLLDAGTKDADLKSAFYVITQERVQLTLANHPAFSASIVVVDEAQSISDGARVVLLQWVLDDLLARKAGAQTLFASPNVRNLDVFGHLFGLDDIKQVSSTEPTVAQNFLIIKILFATKGRGLGPSNISGLRNGGHANRDWPHVG